MAAWAGMADDAYDCAEAYGETDDYPTGGFYESWRQDDDVFARLADAIDESARLNAELANLIGLVA